MELSTAMDAKIKPIRLADVAKAAGVSHGTASNVFSRPEIVREEVRERVKAAAEKLGYGGPDPKGRLLRAGKVNAIGVAAAWELSYFFEDPFARLVMDGIAQGMRPRGRRHLAGVGNQLGAARLEHFAAPWSTASSSSARKTGHASWSSRASANCLSSRSTSRATTRRSPASASTTGPAREWPRNISSGSATAASPF